MKIELSETQLLTIIQGLSMLPYRKSAQLIAYIHLKVNPPKTDQEQTDEPSETQAA